VSYKIITPVATEPVSLTEAKLHLRVTDTAEDDLISALITTAREYCEKFTGRSLAEQTVEYYLDRFPCADEINLPMPPLQSVTSVKYTDSDGIETTMPTDAYLVDAVAGRVVLPYYGVWPSFTPYTVNPVKIRYVAGYTTDVPKSIKQAMLLLIGHWYMNREATGDATGQIAFAVRALLSMHKVRWL